VGDGHHGTHGEQAERREHRPDVGLASVAERVFRVARFCRAALRDQQKHLISGVRPRVRGLRDERRGSGERGGDRLRDGDQQIRAERDEYGQRALAAPAFVVLVRHVSILPLPVDGLCG